MMKNYDAAIIGGGIVGLGAALALAERGVGVVVLEKEPRLATHQTGRNSGVIHSGLYYAPGSLKARNCVEGRKALVEFCRARGVPFEICGKLVVATHERERPALEQLAARGAENGLEGLRRLEGAELREYEPRATGVAGLWVPETGIVDFGKVAEAYAAALRERGGEILTGARVGRVGRTRDAPRDLLLRTPRGQLTCRALVNCAGLQSDRVARACGANPGLRIVPFRGEYYELIAARRRLIKNLIYPVPDPELPFLGVHFTRRIDGSIEAGPNAVLAFKREGYGRWNFSLRDAWSILTYGAFWRMARRNWRTALGEQYRALSKRTFAGALRRLVPELRLEDLQRGGAGVRAQAVDPDGALVDDFRIVETENAVHVLNAPSPAATASLAIGQTIAELTMPKLG